MKHSILILLLSFIAFTSNSQGDLRPEVGFDGYFGGSNFGGSVGIGGKFGFEIGEYFVAGPSLRYHRTWNHNTLTGAKGGFNIFGGGGYLHARFAEVLFVGTEFEVLKSPFSYNKDGSIGAWIPTWYFGGGYSQLINESWRLNFGVFYDVLDIPNPSDPTNLNPNSPTQPYLFRKTNGTIIPMIYRLAIFIPLY